MPVEPIDYCAEAGRLRELRIAMASGEGVAETRFGLDMVRFHKGDPARLDRLIDEADRLCSISTGVTPRRRRFAISGRFRPY